MSARHCEVSANRMPRVAVTTSAADDQDFCHARDLYSAGSRSEVRRCQMNRSALIVGQSIACFLRIATGTPPTEPGGIRGRACGLAKSYHSYSCNPGGCTNQTANGAPSYCPFEVARTGRVAPVLTTVLNRLRSVVCDRFPARTGFIPERGQQEVPGPGPGQGRDVAARQSREPH